MNEKKVLIICTGNSCRGRRGKAILRNALGNLHEGYSAGAKPYPLVIEVMKNGIDTYAHESNHLDRTLDVAIDTAITIRRNTNDASLIFPGDIHRYHWGFEEPTHSTMARN